MLPLQIPRDSYRNWRFSPSNSWSDNTMPGSWSGARFKRKVKRNADGERRVRVLWDDGGHDSEQVYIYYDEEPGLWTAEKLRPMERELISRGIGL